MWKSKRLYQTSYSAGNSFELPLGDAMVAQMAGRVLYLAGIFLRIDLTLTSASTSDAISAYQFDTVLRSLMFRDVAGNPFGTAHPLNLASMRYLGYYARRSALNLPAAISANSNTTNTRRIDYYFPQTIRWLEDPYACLQPACFLERLEGVWCPSTIFGTGQTITTLTLTVAMDVVALSGIWMRPRLELAARPVIAYRDGYVPIQGRMLALAGADMTAGATTTIGATDYTDSQISGNELKTDLENIDLQSRIVNQAFGDSAEEILDLPSSGSARHFPLFVPWGPGNADESVQLSHCPEENSPNVRIETGAGNPATTDIQYHTLVVRPRDDDGWVANLGHKPRLPITPDQVRRALKMNRANDKVRGKRGVVDFDSSMWRYLPRQVA